MTNTIVTAQHLFGLSYVRNAIFKIVSHLEGTRYCLKESVLYHEDAFRKYLEKIRV